VGQRSNTETIAAILKAFLDQRTWKQADLARHVGVQPAAIRKRLDELVASGIPLQREHEHPHVYWSVPKSWYPGGVLLTGEQVRELFRQLSRLPRSKARNRLIESLLRYMPAAAEPNALVTGETTHREEAHLPVIEDSAMQKKALRFRYYTAGRGSEGTRFASVHRVVLGPPARFLATCHRDATLKWFRVDNVSDAKLDAGERFRDADGKTVDAHHRASLDGFHGGVPPAKHQFFVADPNARWVARNLMHEMEFEEESGGIRITVETSAVSRLARFVVGLGAAAKPLTPDLEREVVALANGALEACSESTKQPRGARKTHK
jgi:predicted DNA-binding transcriptional regulator YafY